MLWSIVAAQPSPSQAGFCIDMDFGQHPNLPPSKSDKTQYLLTGAKFEFAVKTKKFLGGIAPMRAKPPGAIGPRGVQGLGRRPTNCSQATWVLARRAKTQVAPTGQAVRGTGWG